MGERIQGALDEALDKVMGWVEALVTHLPNLVAAIVVLAVFWALAAVIRRGVRGVLSRMIDHPPVRRLLEFAAYIAVLAAGVFVALDVLSLDRAVVSLLAGVGIVGLALGFAFQDIAENMIAGVMLSIRRPFREGDVVETNEHMGVVSYLDLRAVVIRTFAGQLVRIPNAEVFKKPLVNYSSTGLRRVDLLVGVSYGDDLDKARSVALEAVRAVEGRDAEREPELFYQGFGASSIDFQVRFWIPFARQTDFVRARSDAVMRIKQAFDRENVTIPFPIRTLDFSQVGGRLLADELRDATSKGQ